MKKLTLEIKPKIGFGELEFGGTKEKLISFLGDVVLGGGKPIWRKLFDKLGGYFDKRFGPDWKEKDKFFKEFEGALRQDLTD